MSFVARRFGSAGFSTSHSSQTTLTAVRPDDSGVSLRTPFVIAVGVEDDVAALATTAAREVDIGFLRVAHGPAACRAIPESRPTVVAVAARLWADERNAVIELAHQVGAEVIELSRSSTPEEQAMTLIRAAIDVESNAYAFASLETIAS